MGHDAGRYDEQADNHDELDDDGQGGDDDEDGKHDYASDGDNGGGGLDHSDGGGGGGGGDGGGGGGGGGGGFDDPVDFSSRDRLCFCVTESFLSAQQEHARKQLPTTVLGTFRLALCY